MTETFYDVLGVDPGATTSDIEDAYRERIKETHPDLNDDEDADEATQRVIEARNVLSDEEERERYDRLGHAAYVGDADGGTTETDADESGGSASRAAREAGWTDDDSTGPSESTAAGTNAGPYERRKRERSASERVREERTRAAGSRATDHSTSSAGVDGTATGAGGSTTARTASGATAAGSSGPTSSAASGGTRSQRRREQIYDAGAWSASTEYNVRKDVDSGVHPLRLLFSGTPLSLVVLTFFLYPVMLFSTVFPEFPLVVNVTVGLCTLFLIGYLQSQPSVGVLVFGTWSLLVPLGIVLFEADPTGLVGLLALAGAWFPFGFSVLTLWILRF